MELSKQEMEIFIPFPGLESKNFLYKNFFIYTKEFKIHEGLRSKKIFDKKFFILTKEFKIDFQNRKWNYPNRKWNHLSHLQASDQRISLTKSFSYIPKSSKSENSFYKMFHIFIKEFRISPVSTYFDL